MDATTTTLGVSVTRLETEAGPTEAVTVLAGRAARSGPGSPDEALEAARAFERLLVQDMLRAMRRAIPTESPSNARSLYEDMLDERLAGVIDEAGGLGLAPRIARALGERSGGGPATEGAGGSTDAGLASRGLAAADLLRLRALAAGERGDAARGLSTAARAAASDVAAAHGSSLTALADRAGSAPTRESAFVTPLMPHATRAARRLGTTPEAVLAVAALETGWGRHVMSAADGASSHNLFGIKRSPAAIGTVRHETTEYLAGRARRVVADFARFPSEAAAVDAFADFILDNPRYAEALERAGDPPEFLRRLQSAGYATDPRYADKAIALMQRIERLQETL